MQQGKLRHGFDILVKRLTKDGVFRTLMFCQRRMCNMLFSRYTFNRWDLNVYHDARINGVENMKIVRLFSVERGLWMETICSYGGGHVQHFTPSLIIGDNVSLSEYVHIGCVNHIEIGNNVLMGSKIYITDHNHGVYRGNHPDSPDVPPVKRPLTTGEAVIIEDNVWIGEFCTILPGVTIGYGSIIGSHTTVTHDIPPRCIAVGSPARVIKQWDEEKKAWITVTRK